MNNLGPGAGEAGGETPETAASETSEQRETRELAAAAAAKAEEDAVVLDAEEEAAPAEAEAAGPADISVAEDPQAEAPADEAQLEAEFSTGPKPSKEASRQEPAGPGKPPQFDNPSLEDEVINVRQSHPRDDDTSVKAKYYRESKKFLDIKRNTLGQGIQLSDDDANMLADVSEVNPEAPRLSMTFKSGANVAIGNKTARASGLRTLEEMDLAASQIVANAKAQGMGRLRITGSDPEAKDRLYYHARAAGMEAFGHIPKVPPRQRKAEIAGIKAMMAKDRDFRYQDTRAAQLGAEFSGPGPDPDPGAAPSGGPEGPDGGPNNDSGGGGAAKSMDLATVTAGAATAPGGLLGAVQETLRGGAAEASIPSAADLGISQKQATQLDAVAIKMAEVKLNVEAMPLGTDQAYVDAARQRFEQVAPGIGSDVHDHLFGQPNERTTAAFKSMLAQGGIEADGAQLDGIADRMRTTAEKHMADERVFANGTAPDDQPRPAEPAAEATGTEVGFPVERAGVKPPTTAALVDALNPSTGKGVDAKQAIQVVSEDPKVRRAVDRAAAALPAIIEGAATAAKTGGVKGAIVAAGKGIADAAMSGDDLSAGAVAQLHEKRTQAAIAGPVPGDVPALPPPPEKRSDGGLGMG